MRQFSHSRGAGCGSRTYGDVIAEYRIHPDRKSGDPDGGQGHRGSRGVLPRLHVEASGIRHTGKESNRLDEVEDGVVFDPEEVYVEYRDERQEWLHMIVPQLRGLQARVGAAALRGASGLSERALRDAVSGRHVPRRRARAALRQILSTEAAQL